MKPVIGLLGGACCAALIACGAGQSRSPAMPAPAAEPAPADSSLAPPAGAARDEIAALAAAIEADLGQLGLPPPAPPACVAAAGCAEAMPAPMSVTPAQQDPACAVGASATCRDACTLSDAICTSAARICELATELGGDDAYANEKCESGKTSCTTSRTRCCGCV